MKKHYTYNSETLTYEEVYKVPLYVKILMIVLVITTLSLITPEPERVYIESETIIKLETQDTFTKERLVQMLIDLNVKYPDIALAQSMIETANWTSPIWIENHNGFGMREAKSRINLAAGTQRSHAYYNHWRESVYDYCYWVAAYANNLSREEFLLYLDKVYAEGYKYDIAIKQKIKSEKLQELFKKK